jgi:hypothetical protein
MKSTTCRCPAAWLFEGREEEEGISPANWPGFWFLIHFTRLVRDLGLTENQLPI